jgi:hypothetical protein
MIMIGQVSNEKKFDELLTWLTSTKNVPLSTMMDFALLLSGKKQNLRLVVPDKDVSFLENFCHQNSYYFSTAPLIIAPQGNTWNNIEKETSLDANKSEALLFVISKNKDECDKIIKHELNGESDIVGKLLGYPECCVKNYNKLSRTGALWTKYLLESSGKGPYPLYNNRYISALGGISPIGEIFPCSLHCKKSAQLAKDALSALSKMNLHQLRNNIYENSLRSVVVKNDGSLSFLRDHNDHQDNTIHFSEI